MTSSVEILIPGLMPPQWAAGGCDEPSVKVLERALGKATTRGAVSAGEDFGEQLSQFETRLAHRFGLDESFPIAPYCYLADSGERPDQPVMAATPVHLRPEQDRLILFEGEPLALDEGQAAEMVARFNAHFADRGLRLTAPAPNRWYLVDPPHTRITTAPLHEVSGRNVNFALPQGEDARFWAATLNEIQMLFHQDPVNQQREAQGRWVINGLWPHGLGCIQTTHPPTKVWSDHPVTRGLALAGGLTPEPPDQWRPETGPAATSEQLLVVDDFIGPALLGDTEEWRRRLPQVAKKLSPLISWAETGGNLTINPCDGRRFNIHGFCKLRFWRTSRIFA